MIRGKLPPEFSHNQEVHPGRLRPQAVPADLALVDTGRIAAPRLVLRIVTRLWIALLIVGSLQPSRPGVVTGHHREIHWVAFAGAAFLLFSGSSTRRQQILRAFAIFLLGASLEVLQHLIYRNHMEWRDIADDGVAILVAFALYRLTGGWKLGSDPRPKC